MNLALFVLQVQNLARQLKHAICSKFEYNLKNQRKHDHCPTCKEGKLKWNFDKHISACKTIGM